MHFKNFSINWVDKYNKKTWVDEGSEFYKRSTSSWLQGNSLEINSTDNEGIYIVAK